MNNQFKINKQKKWDFYFRKQTVAIYAGMKFLLASYPTLFWKKGNVCEQIWFGIPYLFMQNKRLMSITCNTFSSFRSKRQCFLCFVTHKSYFPIKITVRLRVWVRGYILWLGLHLGKGLNLGKIVITSFVGSFFIVMEVKVVRFQTCKLVRFFSDFAISCYCYGLSSD